MKSPEHITLPTGLTTLSEIIRWREILIQLHARLSPYFARREPRKRALRFVQGILSSVERKNGGSYTALVNYWLLALKEIEKT